MGISPRSSRWASRAAVCTLALVFALATAVVADAGACAPVCKTGANGQRFEWTPGKT